MVAFAHPKHADYHLAALADACENVCSRSRAPILSDESPEVAIPDSIIDFGGLCGTQEQDIGVYTELYTGVGVRKFTSIDKAHFQIGEPKPIPEKHTEWEALPDSIRSAEANRVKKMPGPLKMKRGKPCAYIAKRHWNDDHYPPPGRASPAECYTTVTQAMAPLPLAA
jgi:hypothetical protein